MKRNLLLIFFLAASLNSKSQITYFNYLNYTVESYFKIEGFGQRTYYTYFFDGDTLINGNSYYKKYSLVLDSSWGGLLGGGDLTVTKSSGGPFFIREDNSRKFYTYKSSNNTETVSFDWDSIIKLKINDTFPGYTSCTIQVIDSIYLGNQPLKRFRNTAYPTFDIPNALVEGIGLLGSPCGIGIETNSWTACYVKDGITLSFSKTNCNSFLAPVRRNTFVKNISSDKEFSIYPNPATSILSIRSNSTSKQIDLRDLLGRTFYQYPVTGKQTTIKISQLPAGIYLAVVKNEDGTSSVKKFVKE